jgi:hypothetical protein
LPRHHPRDLHQVIEIVNNPRGQELPQGDDAKRRMASAAIQELVRDVP